MAPSLGLVIPAFRPDVEQLAAYVRALDERLAPATIRIELDDPDPAEAEALADLPAEVFPVPYRRGKGAAVTAGFEALDTEIRCFVDADGSTPAKSVAQILEPLYSGRADLSVGSRRHPNSRVRSHQTLGRRYLGDGFAWLARRLLDAHLYDYQCGAKALTAEAWEVVRGHLYEPGFAWDVELVAMAGALDLRVVEVPIEWEDMPGSTVSPIATALSMGKALFVARHRAKRVQHSPFHDAIAARREQPVALVDREER
jgi:glycosyltransferase involved in cell wall biosynthesis